MTNDQLESLKKAAQAATPQNLDSAEIINREPGLVDCPTCGGDGYAQFHADFCNYDGHALGVQFYGIGPEHKAAEAYFRAASPATILALIERVEFLEAGKADLLTQLVEKEAARVRNAQAWELASMERDELRAARTAYASEFPLNADGEPDVGNVHANIRAMKDRLGAMAKDMTVVRKSILQDLIDDVEDYAASRTFKDAETAWRRDLLTRARAAIAAKENP